MVRLRHWKRKKDTNGGRYSLLTAVAVVVVVVVIVVVNAVNAVSCVLCRVIELTVGDVLD